MNLTTTPATALPRAHHGLAALTWAAGWAAMLLLDGHVDLANLAMLLVLCSAVSSLWLPVWTTVLGSVAAVLAFNWLFVPPRGTFTVDLHLHALLLGSMLVVNAIVSALMLALRRQARQAQNHAERAEQLRRWGDTLRDSAEPLACAGQLQALLGQNDRLQVALLLLRHGTTATPDDADATLLLGQPDADQRTGLWHCLRQGRALGPGSGRYEDQPDLYLPLRGREQCLGAAVLIGWQTGHGAAGSDAETDTSASLPAHLQALCDQMGLALQRHLSTQAEQQARAAAQSQAVRNTLLAAISHDYRTPLATIMGAASSLQQQDERLTPAQRRQLAGRIVDEATRLSRLTDNTLQLARLDAPGVALRCDWESAEELIGACLHRQRQRDPARRVRARLEPELPLLWCDALLLTQLLDNLLDNALKYSPPDSPIELLARRQDGALLLAVRDRGPGIAPAWRERVFEVFQRGDGHDSGHPTDASADSSVAQRPGSGVGLAVCRAIARAHGGELRLRARGHGGCSFECLLPLRLPPADPPVDPPAAAPAEAAAVHLQADEAP
ncbi:MAG: hypothetical protein RJA44_1144 [Pseudomonadota bacterium]